MSITVSAPGKLMILGGHAVVYGYPCIVSAIDKYLTVKLEKAKKNKDTILTPGVSDKSLVQQTIDLFRKTYHREDPIHLVIDSQISGYGLGSSAAVVVATMKALTTQCNIFITKKELFNLSCQVIRQREKKASGFDIASCIWGGTIYFDGKTKEVEYLLDTPVPLVVGFSGVKASTQKMVEKVSRLKRKKPQVVEHIFQQLAKLTRKGKKAIPEKNWISLGKLMHTSDAWLKELQVSTIQLDKMVMAAMEAGSYGAKLSGAGGGDCMIALVNDKRRVKVKKAIEKVGGKVLDIKVGIGKGVYKN